MRIAVVTPSRPDSPLGNSITANRWTEILTRLGHQVQTSTEWDGSDAEVLIALHARRSYASVRRFHDSYPGRPIVVGLTGTDLYLDVRSSKEARDSLAIAARLVGLQERAYEELDESLRSKVRVIYQSAVAPPVRLQPLEDCFEVCVSAHLRDVKDPLRAAWAARLLPADSRIRITHVGRALDELWAKRAAEEERDNPRYRWAGEKDHSGALDVLARSQAVVVSSEVEGGANVIAEAAVCGVPILCSRIPGNLGMLGSGYAGYYELRDTEGLARLLSGFETDLIFRDQLRSFMSGLTPRFSYERELHGWEALLYELK